MQLFILLYLLSWQSNFSEINPSPIVIEREIAIQDSLILYNVITPNNDGKNDVLAFKCLDQYQSAEILVVDQWGKKVYESSDYQDDWGGTSNGSPLPAGQYKYFLNLDGRFYSSNLSIIYD